MRLLRYAISVVVLIFFSGYAWGQSSVSTTYSFLKVPQHARLAALGGVNVSRYNADVNFFFNNPALTGDSLVGWASAGYMFYVADIGQSTFSGTFKSPKNFVSSIGVQHINYGEIEATDATGLPIGNFRSGETALVYSISHQVSAFRLGVNTKLLFSNLAGFNSAAFALDLGGVFIHPHRDFTVGLVIKNIGFTLSDYSDTNQPSVPFDVQIGTSFKPEHMPVRFSITAYNLTRNNYFAESIPDEESTTLKKVISHFNMGAEILIHRNVNVLLGYNALRQQELNVQQGGGGSGFTFGFVTRIKSFDFVFSRSRFSVGNANYSFTLAADLKKIIKKKRVV
ncbi:MAG: type IX secretion system protein PorQ [Cyclobacteriaceae bacterium]|nr:type IX secretion system protein PorQ [Cyclobacteriaceae bacterium]